MPHIRRPWKDPDYGTGPCECGYDPPEPGDFSEVIFRHFTRTRRKRPLVYVQTTCCRCGAVSRDALDATQRRLMGV